MFIVENNQYAYSTPLSRQQYSSPASPTGPPATGIPGVTVDGNDVDAVFDAASIAVSRAREGHGPTIIEGVTMRMDGHAIHDSAPYVPEDLLAEWSARDPIALLQHRLEAPGSPRSWFDTVRAECDGLVRKSLARAQAEPLPDPATLCDGVYAELA